MGLWLSPVGWDSNVCSLNLNSPSKAAQGNETKAVIMWVFLRSPLSIFCLFLNGMPPAGQQLPIRGPLLWPATYIHPEEVFIYLLFAAFPPDNPLRIPSMPCRGKGVLGGISPYRWGWHHLPSFPLAGQQHLCHHNELTGLSHLLGSDNEARSLSCPGSGVYW